MMIFRLAALDLFPLLLLALCCLWSCGALVQELFLRVGSAGKPIVQCFNDTGGRAATALVVS